MKHTSRHILPLVLILMMAVGCMHRKSSSLNSQEELSLLFYYNNYSYLFGFTLSEDTVYVDPRKSDLILRELPLSDTSKNYVLHITPTFNEMEFIGAIDGTGESVDISRSYIISGQDSFVEAYGYGSLLMKVRDKNILRHNLKNCPHTLLRGVDHIDTTNMLSNGLKEILSKCRCQEYL
jgi:hypothetical protein